VAKILVSAGSKDVAVGTPICVVCEESGDVGAFAGYVPTAGAETAGTPPTTPDAPAAAAPAKAAAPAAAPAAKQASDMPLPLSFLVSSRLWLLWVLAHVCLSNAQRDVWDRRHRAGVQSRLYADSTPPKTEHTLPSDA
jgi:pyruvate/2-oxoglutarate dehydrogenase complex dihydrolipoamide acyltransferase (E2) component